MKSAQKSIAPFLDESGKITGLPAKRASRNAVLEYLAGKFEAGRFYTEKEVNALCERWHTFGDYFLLRRELVDYRFLARRRDGSRYWKLSQEEKEVTTHGPSQGAEGPI